MSRPVYEPSLTRADAAQAWASRQLFRRPAPTTEGGGTAVIHMFSWNYVDDNTVPNATWSAVADFAGGKGFFEETFYAPLDVGGITYDCEGGTFGLADDAEYQLHGYVQFNESTVIDNELRAVAINFGSSDRVISTFRLDIADGSPSLGEYKLSVTANRLVGFGITTPFLECWQNSGGDLTIRAAEFWVRRFEFVADGEFVLCENSS